MIGEPGPGFVGLAAHESPPLAGSHARHSDRARPGAEVPDQITRPGEAPDQVKGLGDGLLPPECLLLGGDRLDQIDQGLVGRRPVERPLRKTRIGVCWLRIWPPSRTIPFALRIAVTSHQ